MVITLGVIDSRNGMSRPWFTAAICLPVTLEYATGVFSLARVPSTSTSLSVMVGTVSVAAGCATAARVAIVAATVNKVFFIVLIK